MGRRAFLGLGSNVGNREGHLRDAISRLGAAAGMNFVGASRVYETEPIGVVEQAEFLNLVVEIEVEEGLSLRELLELVKRVEGEVGRRPRQRWGPREIDIDVLLVGEERAVEEGCEVPHPRMWERAFVMAPLAELAPEVMGPEGETAAEIAERLCKEQKVHATIRL